MRTRYSTISIEMRRCSRAAPARTTVRSARAIRPPRPITLPTSSGATWSRSASSPSRSSVSTRTASGSSTSRRASSSRSSAVAEPLDLEELRDRVGRLSALAEPVLDLVLVELDRRRLGLGVVAPDDLDEPAVARRARIGHHDAVDRVLLRAHPRQSHSHCHLLPRLSLRLALVLGPAHGRRAAVRKCGHPALPHLLHHLRHLPAPLEQLVDLLHRRARAR